MKKTILMTVAGMMLAGGVALAQTPSTDGGAMPAPAPEAAPGGGQGGGHHGGYHGGHHGDGKGRFHGEHRGGHMKGHGGHRGHGMRGGRRGGGTGQLFKSENPGFALRFGRGGSLMVNCGETPIADCMGAAQDLIGSLPTPPARGDRAPAADE